jgi:hypothetical protein
MTEAEMPLIGKLLFRSGKNHVVFDERADDKRLLLVSKDAPTMLRFILASPCTSEVQKMFAEDTLKDFMALDKTVTKVQQTPFGNDALYCAPDSDQE